MTTEKVSMNKTFLETLFEKISLEIHKDHSAETSFDNSDCPHSADWPLNNIQFNNPKTCSNKKKSNYNYTKIDNEPSCLTHLLTDLELNKYTSEIKQKSDPTFFSKNNPYFSPLDKNAPQSSINKNRRPKHNLTTDQWIIWNRWNKNGISLKESFSRKELKQAYYQLALIYHPDRQTGNSQEFIQIKKEYERLLQVF